MAAVDVLNAAAGAPTNAILSSDGSQIRSMAMRTAGRPGRDKPGWPAVCSTSLIEAVANHG
jgi:hypothetical protein